MLDIRIRTTDTGGPHDLPLDLRSTLDDISDSWRSGIVARTRAGRGVDGRALRPKRDGSPARLHDSGKLLASLRADVHDSGFRIAPAGRRNVTIAAIHQASGRRWAGADDRQIEDARRAVVDALQGKQ